MDKDTNLNQIKFKPNWNHCPKGTTHYLHIKKRSRWHKLKNGIWYQWSVGTGWIKVQGKVHIHQLETLALKWGDSYE